MAKLSSNQQKRLEETLAREISNYRNRILDLAEEHLGTSPHWRIVRSRLLRHFGDRGLSGKVCEALNGEFSGEAYE